MARTLYPATIAYGAGIAGGALTSAAGRTVDVFTDAALTVPADLALTLAGPSIGHTLTITAGSTTPAFYGPDGFTGPLYTAGLSGAVDIIYPAAGAGSFQPADPDLTAIAAIDATQAGVLASDGAGWISKSYAALKTALGLTKGDVGLGNVTNTSDANKPVSTAQQAALDLKAPLDSPALTGNPTAPTPTAGDNDTSIATTAFVAQAVGSSVASLTPTATKTGAYTVAVGQIAMMNVPAGATALALPAAPADKAQVGYRASGATAAVPLVITRGGSDTIGTAGATTASVPLADEVAVLQYDAPNTRWLAVANVKTQASLDGRYQSGLVGRRTPQLVGNANYLLSTDRTSNGTDTGANSRTKITVTDACNAVQVKFPNYSTSAAGLNDIVVRFALEDSAGNFYPGFFGGARDATIKADADVTSDPIPLAVAAGGFFWVRAYVTCTSGGRWPNTIETDAGTGEGSASGTSTSDLTTSGTITATHAFAYGPVAVYGRGKLLRSEVACVGDSITGATGANTPYNRNSFAQRALTAASLRHVTVGQGGVSTAGCFGPTFQRRQRAIFGCTHAIVMLGTNDIAGTLSSLQGSLVSVWRQLSDQGMRVWACTIIPKTTSTDNWTTTANQTDATGNSTVRVSVNDWIRAGAPVDSSTLAAVAIGTSGALLAGQVGHPLDGYFETADAVESSRNSGKWKVTGAALYATGDGTHPSDVGHGLIAATINTAALAL